MKTIILITVAVALSGCTPTKYSKSPDGLETMRNLSPSEACIGGVVYYIKGQRLAPAFNKDSTVKTCA